eukprot:978346-Amphidinium_carterae.1
MCWGTPLLHISQTQSTSALNSAEAELCAMVQHFKQVKEEMSIPEMDTDNVTMTKAVASRLVSIANQNMSY